MLLGIFSGKLGTQSITQKGIEAEARGDYSTAKKFYEEVGEKSNSKNYSAGLDGSLRCMSDLGSGGHRFDPHWVLQYSFVEIDDEIFSTVILSLLLIQEGQLSVSGKRMCTSTG